MGSQLHVMPVDATGTPQGAPRRVNREVADAPSWSGDSRRLLYLSQGRLRLANARTGEARTVDVPLRYRPRRPQRTPGRPCRTVLGRPGQEAAPRRRHHRRRQPDPEHHAPPPAPLRQGGRRLRPDRHAGPDGLPRPPGLRVALLRRPPGPGQPGLGHHLDALGRRPGLPRDGGSRLRCAPAPGWGRASTPRASPSTGRGSTTTSCGRPGATPRSGAS